MYDNIHIGSNVEICRKNGEILTGKVKWKGSIVHRKGFWIGVELDDQGRYLVSISNIILCFEIISYYCRLEYAIECSSIFFTFIFNFRWET